MPAIEVLDVTLALTGDDLRGAALDAPAAGARRDGRFLEIIGWAVGRGQAAVAVELYCGEKLLRRAPIDRRRPDIAAAFPGAAGAERSGFSLSLGLLGPEAVTLELQVVLADHRRLPLARVRAREEAPPAGLPLASVIIPCYRQAHFLDEAIESVLAQSYANVEVLVVDDESPDNTAEVAARYPGVRYIWQRNQERSAARNHGARQSRGDLLVFLDGDDRLRPNAIAAGAALLAERPGHAIAAGHFHYLSVDGRSFPPPWEQQVIERDYYKVLLHHCTIMPPAAALIRRAAFEEAGGFDLRLRASEDHDLFLRIGRRHQIVGHGEVVVEYRQHGANTVRQSALMLSTSQRVLAQQRRYTRWSSFYQAARLQGMKNYRHGFGEPLVADVHAALQDRRWRSVLGGVVTLLRYYPNGMRELLTRVTWR